jgi:hypothetical protein
MDTRHPPLKPTRLRGRVNPDKPSSEQVSVPNDRQAPQPQLQPQLSHRSSVDIGKYMKKRLPKIAFGILLVGSVGYLASSVKKIIENSLMIHNFTTLWCNHIERSA